MTARHLSCMDLQAVRAQRMHRCDVLCLLARACVADAREQACKHTLCCGQATTLTWLLRCLSCCPCVFCPNQSGAAKLNFAVDTYLENETDAAAYQAYLKDEAAHKPKRRRRPSSVSGVAVAAPRLVGASAPVQGSASGAAAMVVAACAGANGYMTLESYLRSAPVRCHRPHHTSSHIMAVTHASASTANVAKSTELMFAAAPSTTHYRPVGGRLDGDWRALSRHGHAPPDSHSCCSSRRRRRRRTHTTGKAPRRANTVRMIACHAMLLLLLLLLPQLLMLFACVCAGICVSVAKWYTCACACAFACLP